MAILIIKGSVNYCITGNFQGRKNLYNFRDFTATYYAISLTFRESFLHEMLPSYQSAKVFSLKNFSLYGITGRCIIACSLKIPMLPIYNIIPPSATNIFYLFISLYKHKITCLKWRAWDEAIIIIIAIM